MRTSTMIKAIGGIFLGLTILVLPRQSSSQVDAWVTGPPVPTPRSGAMAAAIGGVLYVAGGETALFDTPVLEAYDTGTSTWSTLAPLPQLDSGAASRIDGAIGVISGKLYLAGGARHGSELPTSSLEVYDPATNTWATRAPVPIPSACSASAVIGGKFYVLTGCVGIGGFTNLLHVYDPIADAWSQKASSPHVHADSASGVIGGKFYVAGGLDDNGAPSATLDIYDPATDTWAAGTPMPTARSGAAGGAIAGKLYVAGGVNSSGLLSTLEAYDPLTAGWTTKVPMPTRRAALAGAVIGGAFYAVGGSLPTVIVGRPQFANALEVYGQCVYSLTATSKSFGPSGGSDSVDVMAPAGCNWTAVSNASWITIAPSNNRTGNGTVNYSVACAALPGGSNRVGTMAIAGQTFTVTQVGPVPGPPCPVRLSPTGQSFASGGGSGVVGVAADCTCAWAVTSNANWITIPPGSNGSGNGTVNYFVGANGNTGTRMGTISIGDKTFTVTQGGVGCSYSILPTSQPFSAGGGTGSVSVSTSSGCNWGATSNASWITVTSGGTGIGNGTVDYSVGANPDTSPRNGAIAIANQALTITQAGSAAPGPSITSASISGKNLVVTGQNFDSGAVIVLNGEDQRTIHDDQNPGTLIGKKVGRKIPDNQPVTLQVRNSDGTVSAAFGFNRSGGPIETATAIITASQGGSITLPSGSSVSMPQGMFQTDQSVTLSRLLPSATVENDYLDASALFDAGPNAGQVFVVNAGDAVPRAQMAVSLNVPDDFLNSLGQAYTPRLFVKAFWQGDDEAEDVFELVDSRFDPGSKQLSAQVPEWGFTDQRSGGIGFECALLIGALRIAPTTTIKRTTRASVKVEADSCPISFYPPLLGLTPDELRQKIKTDANGNLLNAYGERDIVINGKVEHEFHTGIDYSDIRGPKAVQVVPAASGYVVNIRWSITTGQTVIVEHVVKDSAGKEIRYRTSYQHLEKDSVRLFDKDGNAVEYPDMPTEADGTNEKVFAAGEIPVAGGVTPIGTMDCSGSRCYGSHLHFEFGPAAAIPSSTRLGGRIDPLSCITLDPPVCHYSLSQPGPPFSNGGGNGSLTVTTSNGCTWTAMSSADWITITSAGNSSGTGTVTYSIAPNTGSKRTGAITVTAPGFKQDFAISQDGTGGSDTLTGTWVGTWMRPVTGFCDVTSSLTWNLIQDGSDVTGTFVEVITATDGFLCPDPVGTRKTGQLVQGRINGNNLTILTEGGTPFSGTFTSTTISGTGGGSLGRGPFSLQRQ